MVSINSLVEIAEEIGNVKLKVNHDLTAPRGVTGRNSDNRFIKSVLGWEPSTSLREGLTKTYIWIEWQYMNSKKDRCLLN